MNINHYTYRVTWSAEDNEHVGLCAEFPSLSWLAATPEKALAGVRRVVKDVVTECKPPEKLSPIPCPTKNTADVVLFVFPARVHRALATEAAEQGVSINRLVSAKLAM